MSNQYRFSLKDECMNEIPYPLPYPAKGLELQKLQMEQYNKHIESLKSIKVPKECLNQFEDRNVYFGHEFENIQEVDDNELWNEAAVVLFKKHNPDLDIEAPLSKSMIIHWYKDMAELQKYYTITKKNK